jgi:hypothetical protein
MKESGGRIGNGSGRVVVAMVAVATTPPLLWFKKSRLPLPTTWLKSGMVRIVGSHTRFHQVPGPRKIRAKASLFGSGYHRVGASDDTLASILSDDDDRFLQEQGTGQAADRKGSHGAIENLVRFGCLACLEMLVQLL